ncbi:MAG: adenosylcobinamide-GDP ribazoletransferase [Pseudomonadota bacterium]
MSEQYYQIFIRRFLIALQFLTRIPVWIKQQAADKDIGCSASYYPLIGLIIGLFLFLFLALLQLLSDSVSSAILAALVLAVWVILTGALHLDGFADSVDGLIGGMSNKDKILEIMQDPHSGPMAVTALIILLLLKWLALESIIDLQQNWVIIFIPALARAYILLLLSTTRYISENGLASILIENFPAQKHINTILFISTIVFIFSLGFWLLILSLLVFILLRYQMNKHIQGVNGDTIGAMVEIIEMTSLLFMVFLLS